jgi:type IV secretory pathway VirB2 component (pilin)
MNKRTQAVGLAVTLVVLNATPVFAFEGMFQNAVDFLSGPFGIVIGALGLGFAGILYIFGGEKHLPRVLAAAVGSLLVMGAPKILQTIQGWAR